MPYALSFYRPFKNTRQERIVLRAIFIKIDEIRRASVGFEV
jgi:hypothetical protein